MTTPRHPGSKVVSQQPNLARVIQTMQAELRRLRDRTRPETIPFTDADPARGVPCISEAMTPTHQAMVYRSGDKLFADVAAGTGAGSVMAFQLAVPALGAVGTATQSAAGGGVQWVRVYLEMPAAWESGAAHVVEVQGRRVSGTDATTARLWRAWQR